MRSFTQLSLIYSLIFCSALVQAKEVEYSVYSIQQGISMGEPGEIRLKDFYVNLGSEKGLTQGAVLDVFRRIPMYDDVNEEYYRDLAFPIAQLKVIHVEPSASICRLEKLFPAETNTFVSPRAVMIGDLVQVHKEVRN